MVTFGKCREQARKTQNNGMVPEVLGKIALDIMHRKKS
jgi:hypothetical protein